MGNPKGLQPVAVQRDQPERARWHKLASRSSIDNTRIARDDDPPPAPAIDPGQDEALTAWPAGQRVSIDLDADVAAVLREHAAQAAHQ
jgi:hypothetical protein